MMFFGKYLVAFFCKLDYIYSKTSWFKSSLLLTIKMNTHMNYNSYLKLAIAFLIGKYIQQMREGKQAWLDLGV